MSTCDHCGLPLQVDVNGYYVDETGSADCRQSDTGHELDGKVMEDDEA